MRDRNNNPWLLMDEEAEVEVRPAKAGPRQPKSSPVELLTDFEEVEENFNFTYQASRHEREWINSALGGFYTDHILTDVLHLVRGGKEATVYCCQAHPALGLEWLAAKIYRPRMFRNLKNDAVYKEGRPTLGDDGKALRDQRSQRAIQKKTRIGGEMQITSWIEHEFQTLLLLHAGGTSVPRPVAQSGNAILMEYLGEPGLPAPTLNSVTLQPEQARSLFDQLLEDVVRMLANDRIHADLSAYNVLYWEGAVKIIDFPQVVDPLYNPRGYALLERDIERLCQYFSRYGIRANAHRLARELWERYMRRELG